MSGANASADTGPATETSPYSPPPRRSLAQRLRWPLMLGGPLLILALVAYFVITGGKHQGTDDAYVQIARVPVSPSIAGRVVELDVHENQQVKAGDVLFRLDTGTLQAAVDQARAELAQAELSVTTLKAGYSEQAADLAAAQETVAYTQREMARQRDLMNAGVASRQTYDQAVHAADQARAQAVAARQHLAAAAANLGGRPRVSSAANPGVMQARAALERALLNLSYATVVAPMDGVVTRVDQLQPGAYVNAAQPLFWLVSGKPWVEANFKEDQLDRMRIGQPVKIRIDAYPHAKLTGRVTSFSPGTGSTFSVLPAQNAAGNWVKVVQRLPVRIEFDRLPPEIAASAGLSAKVTVDTSAPVRAKPRG